MELIEFAKKAIEIPVRFIDRGRSFHGWDCWGLIFMAFKLVYGIELDSLNYNSCFSKEAVKDFEMESKNYKEIKLGFEKPGDIVVFRLCHVALIIGNNDMLHVQPGYFTCIDSYRKGNWEPRIIGIYRHAKFG